jgi:carbon-monoxide dehydrogenase small subunit
MKINFTINGRRVTKEVENHQRLLDLIRDDLNLYGTKEGCAIGECGVCTVLFNGEAVNSCMMLAPQADGAEILTVEGLAKDDDLHPLQTAFLEEGAVQCGFCTPGMLISAYALLLKNPNPTEDEIKDAIAGNLCRCTGYKQIISAVKSVIKNYDAKSLTENTVNSV